MSRTSDGPRGVWYVQGWTYMCLPPGAIEGSGNLPFQLLTPTPALHLLSSTLTSLVRHWGTTDLLGSHCRVVNGEGLPSLPGDRAEMWFFSCPYPSSEWYGGITCCSVPLCCFLPENSHPGQQPCFHSSSRFLLILNSRRKGSVSMAENKMKIMKVVANIYRVHRMYEELCQSLCKKTKTNTKTNRQKLNKSNQQWTLSNGPLTKWNWHSFFQIPTPSAMQAQMLTHYTLQHGATSWCSKIPLFLSPLPLKLPLCKCEDLNWLNP